MISLTTFASYVSSFVITAVHGRNKRHAVEYFKTMKILWGRNRGLENKIKDSRRNRKFREESRTLLLVIYYDKNIFTRITLKSYNLSFTADSAFLSFFVDAELTFALIWLLTWSCNCVKNAVEDLGAFWPVSSDFVIFLSLVSFFTNAALFCLYFLLIPGFNAFNFSFSSIAFCLTRCRNFFRLLSRFLSVFVLSDLPTTSPRGLAKNKNHVKEHHAVNPSTHTIIGLFFFEELAHIFSELKKKSRYITKTW